MSTLIALLGVLIAGFGACIAYFQWRTVHQRIVLDLFDRRREVFDNIEEGAKGILNAVSKKDTQEPFWKFVKAESRARFFFGDEVTRALVAVRSDIASVMAFSDISVEHPEFEHLNDRKHRSLQNLAAFIQNTSGPLFAPYLRLDQKMPSLWWPKFKRH
jgi:hypothetical protein